MNEFGTREVAPPPTQAQDKWFYRVIAGGLVLGIVIIAIGAVIGMLRDATLPAEAYTLATSCVIAVAAVLRVEGRNP